MRLRLQNLDLNFGEDSVLRDLSVESGEPSVLAIVGPSGGGKSTLLRILAGLLRPSSGDVYWDDVRMSFSEKNLLAYRRRVGTVFQSFNLFPHLSAVENIALPLRTVHRFSQGDAMERAEHYLDRFQLSKHLHKKPGELSGGQRQRAAIARAMAFEPKLLFFDEPTSSLDPEMTYEVLEAIREIRNDGRDLVLVTHEINFAEEVADELWFLYDGVITDKGSPKEVIRSAASEEARRFFERVLRW